MRKDWRGRGLAAAGGALVGFLIGMVFFREPWNLPPNWGDVPSWLLVVLAAAAAWVGFGQLRALRQQLAEDALRNVKRDELMDKQIQEAERREDLDRRRLVDDVDVLFNGEAGDVVNKSRRPLTDITCKVMSKVDRHVLATPGRSGTLLSLPGDKVISGGTKPVSRIETLRPGRRCTFIFEGLRHEPDEVVVVWFTGDAGIRWQLDQYLHLAPSEDESEYRS
jgi:hypothetical protein